MQLESSVTLFDDEKVESKFAELVVDADGIRTEVSKKVGNNEVISRINQSAESVQIQANKVAIEGAAIFTSGRLSTTSLNNTYDANGSATGAVNGLKNDLSSAGGTTVINGGHIATGTLSANAVNAASGTFNTANIPNLSADKITSGSISADRIKANVINAVNGGNGQINADKIKVSDIEIGAAQITSGTINSARIPNLSADKITTGTINIGRLPAKGRADTYITDITGGDGIKVHDATNVNNYAQIDSSGFDVRINDVSYAKYGTASRIGKEGASHIEMDYHSLQLKDSDSPSHTYFWVSDLRDENNEYAYTETFTGTGYTTRFTLSYGAKRDKELSVTVSDGSGGEAYLDPSNARWLRFETAPTKGSTITVSYTTNSYFAKAYTLGIRKNNSVIGPLSTCFGSDNIASGSRSLAEGWNTEATGAMSHSEGYGSKATGLDSHAEGESTTASGHYSHAEGDNSIASGMRSHAEGSSTASGEYAHSEGDETVASGHCSHAQNLFTIAAKSYQTAIGKYNKEDNETTQNMQKAFIIGNGTSDDQRSDAMTVDWLGNEVIAGTLTQSSDRRLKTHVSYLGEDAVDFIKKLKPAHFVKDGEHHVGFYAQDVSEVDKWGCMTGEMNGYMTLGYTELIAPLVTYCQKLESRIEQLENKLKEDR